MYIFRQQHVDSLCFKESIKAALGKLVFLAVHLETCYILPEKAPGGLYRKMKKWKTKRNTIENLFK